MAFDLAIFRARFPEFRPVSNSAIEAMADAADLDIDADVYRTKADEARMYLTAHKLVTSPFGKDTRLEDKQEQTTYWREYQRILRLVAPRMIVT